MKKLLCLVMAALLAFTLCGCCIPLPKALLEKADEVLNTVIEEAEEETPVQEGTLYEEKPAEEEYPEEESYPEETPAVQELEEVAFELETAFVTHYLTPPNAEMYYTYYEAENTTDTLAVVVADVTYEGTGRVIAKDAYDLTLTVSGVDYAVSDVIYLKNDGIDFANAFVEMESGVTYRLYYLFSIPKGEEEASMHLLAQRGETVLTTDFTMRSVIEDAPQLQLGDCLLSTDGYNVCVTDLFVTKKLEPSAPAGTYTYYMPEEEGKKLLVLRADVPELSGEESEMNLVMGATLMDAQYGSTPGQIVVEAFDGSNLAGFSTYYPISCNGTLYYLFDVTDEMLEDGAYLLLYAHDVYCVLGLDGVSER